MWVSLLEAAGHLSVVPNHCVVTAGELGTAPILPPASIPCFLGHSGVRTLGLSLRTSMQVFSLEESLCKGDITTVRQILHVRAHTLISVYYPCALPCPCDAFPKGARFFCCSFSYGNISHLGLTPKS